MNRRRLLQAGAALGSVALAGCIDGVAEHFTGGFQGVIPMEIHSEAEQPRNLHIEAHDRETDQQIYEEGITVGAGESVYPSHLRGTAQYLRIAEIDTDDETELEAHQAALSDDTSLVLVRVYDDDIEIEVRTRENDQEAVDDQDTTERETIDDPEDATEFDDSDLDGTDATTDGVDEETETGSETNDTAGADALES